MKLWLAGEHRDLSALRLGAVSEGGPLICGCGFCSTDLDYGFAVWCEAGLCPAVRLQLKMGYALGSPVWAKGRTRGIAQLKLKSHTARHSLASHPAAKP